MLLFILLWLSGPGAKFSIEFMGDISFMVGARSTFVFTVFSFFVPLFIWPVISVVSVVEASLMNFPDSEFSFGLLDMAPFLIILVDWATLGSLEILFVSSG